MARAWRPTTTLAPVRASGFTQDGALGVPPKQLILTLQPSEGVALQLEAKIPGTGMRLTPVSMEFLDGTTFLSQSPEAYERLILDAMRGDATLFTRNDEVEAQWRIVDPILRTWVATRGPLPQYRAGSTGPAEADASSRQGIVGERSDQARWPRDDPAVRAMNPSMTWDPQSREPWRASPQAASPTSYAQLRRAFERQVVRANECVRDPQARPEPGAARHYPPVCPLAAAMQRADAAWRAELQRTTVAEIAAIVAEAVPPAAIQKAIGWVADKLVAARQPRAERARPASLARDGGSAPGRRDRRARLVVAASAMAPRASGGVGAHHHLRSRASSVPPV